MTVVTISLAVGVIALSSCAATFEWIEDRLDPPHEVEGGMLFSYFAPASRQVTLAGNFNNWGGTQGGGRYDASIDPMEDPDGDGIWTVVMPLPPGRYQYKFVIDGGIRWEQDPSNPDTAWEGGFENSLIIVPPTVKYDHEIVTGTVIGEGAAFDRSATEERAAEEVAEGSVEVVFEVDFPDAGTVQLAGTFTNWDPNVYTLARGEDGLWRVEVSLDPGTHLYKFVVDGTWIEDPANPETVDDGHGGVNSVIIVE